MLQNIPSEITIASFSTIGLLTGYIWNTQSKRIDGIKKVQDERPCNLIATNISKIQNDIYWIKKELKK